MGFVYTMHHRIVSYSLNRQKLKLGNKNVKHAFAVNIQAAFLKAA